LLLRNLPSQATHRLLQCNSASDKCMDNPTIARGIPLDSAPRYRIFDRGSNFSEEVVATIKSFGIEPKRTSFQSPWQNGVAERFVGSCRRDLFDDVIVLNERHLKRLMNEYIRFYHEDRTHLGLGKQTPAQRKAERARHWMQELFRCRGSAACIIATRSRPEHSSRTPLNCGRRRVPAQQLQCVHNSSLDIHRPQKTSNHDCRYVPPQS
jgi:hypothetical protein